MTKVLWLSERDMTNDQLNALVLKLGYVGVMKVDKTIDNAFELSKEVEACDIIAIEAPINLQAQFLKMLDDKKPVIIAQTRREIVKSDDGNCKEIFIFDGWKQLKKIEVVMTDFA